MRLNKEICRQFIIYWSYSEGRPKLRRIEFLKKCQPKLKRISSAEIKKIAKKIGLLLKGRHQRFNQQILDWDFCSNFQKKVLKAVSEIPRGKVVTYKLIAASLGKPRAVRAVGSALANNPFPLLIPCHRVIHSSGKLGNYQGGAVLKRDLLEKELKK